MIHSDQMVCDTQMVFIEVVFSYGVMLFELLNEDPLTRSIKQVGDGLMPELKDNVLNNSDLATLVDLYCRCCQMDPAERPIADELLQALFQWENSFF